MHALLPSLVLLSTLCSGCAAAEARPVTLAAPGASSVARPAACEPVAASEWLPRRLAEAREGAVLCLEPGRHSGPLRIGRRVTVWGPRSAIIGGDGSGTVVAIEAAGSQLLGVTVDGRGGRYDREDAAVAVRANDVVVRGVRVENAVFGILANQARRLSIVDNEIHGQREVALGMRGDGIRLWETRDSLIARNQLTDGRDLVVWYSPHNRFEDNVAVGGRYGTHFMHASDNVVRRVRFVGNVVGIFVMYSHRITIEDSQIVDCSAAGGMGVGIKDSGDVVVRRSMFVHNASAVYVDNSPSVISERNTLEHNRFQLNDAALVFHGTTRGNAVEGNDFSSNREQVTVEGGGDAQEVHFAGNRFDDYAGYDLDGDRKGDVPHEARSLAAQLTSARSELSLFRGSAAFAVVEALGKLVPLFSPRTLFVDPSPVLGDPSAEVQHAY
jgi:nitrous oxidase accessory protein